VFLDVLRRRNPGFLEAVARLHEEGQLPANCYVLDLDAVRANAQVLKREADRLGLTMFAMTKQVGRAPGFVRTLLDAGIDSAVAVDMADARAVHAAGMRVGHLGHLVQVPQAEAATAASLDPRFWTVYSREKAEQAVAAAPGQRLLLRIHAPGDVFYEGHEGGFDAERVTQEVGANFAGITTFPALLYDAEAEMVRPTPNLTTLERAADALRRSGVDGFEVNAPGTTSSSTFELLARHGATQVEPGHGFTGTTPLHGVRDLEELPAVCYLTEVSHLHGGRAFAFGGGLYIDPVFPEYRLRALVFDGPGLDASRVLDATIPPPSAIDYYGQLDYGDRAPRIGAGVVFGFRIQAFVTRAYVAGIRRGEVVGIWNVQGGDAQWP
jgi:predicted amino acid racemase